MRWRRPPGRIFANRSCHFVCVDLNQWMMWGEKVIMSSTRVGTNKNYSDNWENIFGGGKKKQSAGGKSAGKSPKKKGAAKKKPAKAAKSTKRKAAKKAAPRGKKRAR
jgi:hypothetical protein